MRFKNDLKSNGEVLCKNKFKFFFFLRKTHVSQRKMSSKTKAHQILNFLSSFLKLLI